MHVLHAGRFELGSVHGTHHALWQLAVAQAGAGHEVTIVNLGWEVAAEHVEIARRSGIRLVGLAVRRSTALWKDDGGSMRRCLEELAPDIVHLQYVRIAELRPFSRILRSLAIPYVVSLHGGMMRAEMVRHRLRKLVWWHAVEKAVHRGAAGIHFVTCAERDDYRQHFGPAAVADAVIANVVEPEGELPNWKGEVRADAPRLVTLGRYDIWHKGLDKLAAMTRALHERGIYAELDLHGSAIGRFEKPMAELLGACRGLPVRDAGMVTGIAKYESLAASDLYVQYSRFELFGMALVEALRVGVPVALSEVCDLAPDLAKARAALVLPMDPGLAAGVVASALADPGEMAAMAARGRAWWHANCRGPVVVAGMDAMYQSALGCAAAAAERTHSVTLVTRAALGRGAAVRKRTARASLAGGAPPR